MQYYVSQKRKSGISIALLDPRKRVSSTTFPRRLSTKNAWNGERRRLDDASTVYRDCYGEYDLNEPMIRRKAILGVLRRVKRFPFSKMLLSRSVDRDRELRRAKIFARHTLSY